MRAKTRTLSKSSVESVGGWMLLSTTVQSKRACRPFSTFSCLPWATKIRLICSQVAGDIRLMFLAMADFLKPLSAIPIRQNPPNEFESAKWKGNSS